MQRMRRVRHARHAIKAAITVHESSFAGNAKIYSVSTIKSASKTKVHKWKVKWNHTMVLSTWSPRADYARDSALREGERRNENEGKSIDQWQNPSRTPVPAGRLQTRRICPDTLALNRTAILSVCCFSPFMWVSFVANVFVGSTL